MTELPVTHSFYLSEFLLSETATRLGLDNMPSASVIANLRNVLMPGMQAVRDLLGLPVLISSGYRSPALNAAVRGSSTSQHCTGNAADFRAPAFGLPKDVAKHLVAHMERLHFDQLIWEGTWVHISFASRARSEVLTAHFGGERTTYTPGIY